MSTHIHVHLPAKKTIDRKVKDVAPSAKMRYNVEIQLPDGSKKVEQLEFPAGKEGGYGGVIKGRIQQLHAGAKILRIVERADSGQDSSKWQVVYLTSSGNKAVSVHASESEAKAAAVAYRQTEKGKTQTVRVYRMVPNDSKYSGGEPGYASAKDALPTISFKGYTLRGMESPPNKYEVFNPKSGKVLKKNLSLEEAKSFATYLNPDE